MSLLRVEIADSKPAEERNEKLNLTGRPSAVRTARVADAAAVPTDGGGTLPCVDTHEAARRWVAGYSAAWKSHDAGAVARLYTEDGVYRSHPFRDPLHGAAGVREYTDWAFSSETDADVWFGEPLAEGNGAAIEYWAVILQRDGAISTLAGTVLLRFGDDGRVTEHRDYWALDDGRRAPYEGWDATA